METTSLIIGIIIGLLLGGILVFILLKKQNESKVSELRAKANDATVKGIAAEEQKKSIVSNLEDKKLELDQLKAEQKSLVEDLNHWKSNAQVLEGRLKDQKEQVGKLQEEFTKEFKIIANEVLEKNSKSFKEENKELQEPRVSLFSFSLSKSMDIILVFKSIEKSFSIFRTFKLENA